MNLETVSVVGGGSFLAAISERAPSAQSAGGATAQRVMLLVPSGERLAPPALLEARGVRLRVLGTQAPPWPGEPSLVSCELVNPDLPDSVQIVDPGARVLDPATGRFTEAASGPLWSGMAHVESGVPPTLDVAGEVTPADRVTITLPVEAPYAAGRVLHVVTARTPGLASARFALSGEVLDSSAGLRRVIGHRLGV